MVQYKRPVIAFASLGDASDPTYSSGAPYAMRQGFLDIGCTVVDAFPLYVPHRSIFRFKAAFHRLNGEYYTENRRPPALRQMAATLNRMIAGREVDFVFAPHTVPATLADLDVPVIISHDQTFRERIAYFAYEARPPAKEYVDEALAQEEMAFHNADLCAYPSQRSLDCIARHHGVSRSKLMLAPWGANLIEEPSRVQVFDAIAARNLDPLRITFIGVDWARKGGDLVVETCRILRERGIDTRLTVIGCEPPLPLPYWATVLPYLDRRVARDAETYRRYLRNSHLMFMPSRVEAYGHVLCEAAAYGIPSVTTDVGGIPTIVVHDETGIALPVTARPGDFADAIQMLVADPGSYTRMGQAARHRFEKKLNWRTFCRSIAEQGLALAAERVTGRVQALAAE